MFGVLRARHLACLSIVRDRRMALRRVNRRSVRLCAVTSVAHIDQQALSTGSLVRFGGVLRTKGDQYSAAALAPSWTNLSAGGPGTTSARRGQLRPRHRGAQVDTPILALPRAVAGRPAVKRIGQVLVPVCGQPAARVNPAARLTKTARETLSVPHVGMPA